MLLLIISIYICRAAAIGSAKDITSNGAWLATACTVLGHESVIQKCLKSVTPLPFDEDDAVKRFHDSLGNTPWVTYALTAKAPCMAAVACKVRLSFQMAFRLQSVKRIVSAKESIDAETSFCRHYYGCRVANLLHRSCLQHLLLQKAISTKTS